MLCGDLHQFPPVAQSRVTSLYQPVDMAHDSIECQIGHRIYEEFTTVVILKQQMRVTLAGFSGASLLRVCARETYSDASQTCSWEGRLKISGLSV